MVSGHDRHRVPRVDARCSQRVRQHVGAALYLREGERTALVDDRRPVGRAHRRETVDDRGRATQVGGSTFTASWTDPSGQVAPITAATYQVCPAGGSGACSAPAAACGVSLFDRARF